MIAPAEQAVMAATMFAERARLLYETDGEVDSVFVAVGRHYIVAALPDGARAEDLGTLIATVVWAARAEVLCFIAEGWTKSYDIEEGEAVYEHPRDLVDVDPTVTTTVPCSAWPVAHPEDWATVLSTTGVDDDGTLTWQIATIPGSMSESEVHNIVTWTLAHPIQFPPPAAKDLADLGDALIERGIAGGFHAELDIVASQN